MKKLFLSAALAALMASPGVASAQYWYWDAPTTYRTYSYPYTTDVTARTLRQDEVRLREARQDLAAAQARLDRDRRQGRWWLLAEDRLRVERARIRVNTALNVYYQNRGDYYSFY